MNTLAVCHPQVGHWQNDVLNYQVCGIIFHICNGKKQVALQCRSCKKVPWHKKINSV